MAFVFKHPKSKFWVAGFVDGTGKRRNRSTKTTNKKLAEKMAEEYEAASRRKRTAQHFRAVLTEMHKEITGAEVNSKTVKVFFKDWLESKEPEVAASTLEFYRNATDKFLKALGAKADEEITEVTRDDVRAFRAQEAKQFAAKTVNHELKCLRMVFKAAKREALISEDPTEHVETVRNRTDEKTRRPFTLPELHAVLKHAEGEWPSMIRFGLYTGQRLSDVASLTWANIDTRRGEIQLKTRKTGKRLTLPISPALQKHIASLPAGDDPKTPIHPKAHDMVKRQGKSGNLSNQFADILAAAGLREKKAHRKSTTGVRGAHELSFHSLRHTATSLLREAGIAPALARAFIGHDSAEMHEQYVDVGNETLRKVAEALPEI